MGSMTCRFYGRFVMVERGGDEAPLTLTFMMPDMTYGGSGLREHKALLTIGRHFVNHKATTLPPTFRSITDGPANEAEDLVWDLSGWTLDVGARGGVNLMVEEGKEIVDLAALEDIMGRKPKLKTSLKPGDGILAASIEVGGGQAFASTAFPTHPAAFIALCDANNPEPPIRRGPNFQVDIIDVTVPTLQPLTLTNKDGKTHQIALRSETPAIALSNLCNALPRRVELDDEFGQYYHFLDHVATDRLVPLVDLGLGDEDCNRQARIHV